ncbi:unnamed protein product [Victoria cruziana]
MDSSSLRISPTSFTVSFIYLLLLVCTFPASSSSSLLSPDSGAPNRTLDVSSELRKIRRIRDHLRRINKPAVKTIQSPEGDLIDCVLSHLQPAFDHPKLRGGRPLDPPERPKGHSTTPAYQTESFQSWSMNGEFCPEGTVPIRRVREADVLRASSMARFGMKARSPALRVVRRDTTSSNHEHAVGYVSGQQFFGAKAGLNVWAPHVDNPNEFSLSQMWVISGAFGEDLNTIEAGWQVSPELYGDSHPRFFTYWTTDAYQTTGCYNLLCSGFVQTNNRIAIGAAISPLSIYGGRQFDISLTIWKDPKRGSWWLEFGSGLLVGYWPSVLFSHLREHANMVQFGGEIVNTRAYGVHTNTEMGNGHFPREGFGKSSYFRNLQVVDWDNSLIPPNNLRMVADHPNCYDIQGGSNRVWGSYFYYGGPGRNVRCP